ncbi:MAG TPA: PIN domain-containing protein [Candidatus Bilamarchaeaceae archaeon]|nr:PIN domain-containing protein [Candidatus Bilamarchaeaceae archaeon]
MITIPFADTDFLLALLKDTDWLKEKATTVYAKHKGKIWVSGYVITELLLVSKRLSLDTERIVADTYRLVEVRGLDESIALLAAHYIKNKKINIFDALHAAYAQFDTILSSDSVFDGLGLERIHLEK